MNNYNGKLPPPPLSVPTQPHLRVRFLFTFHIYGSAQSFPTRVVAAVVVAAVIKFVGGSTNLSDHCLQETSHFLSQSNKHH